MSRKLSWVTVGLIVLSVVLSACGGETESAPALSAPATRTPAPVVDRAAPVDTLAQLEVVSLRESLLAFFDNTADVGPLEHSIVFDQQVSAPHQGCATSEFYPGLQLVALMDGYGLDLVRTDLAGWRVVVEDFDEELLEEALREALARAVEEVPMTGPLRVCMLPVPPARNRQGETFDFFHAEVIDRDAILVACSNAEFCVDTMGGQVVYAYHYAYQLSTVTYDFGAMPLMDMAIFLARADDLALALYPDAQFAWHVELDPLEIPDVWGQMQEYASTTYADYPDNRKIDRLLYGAGTGGYPEWGGMVIAQQVIDAFHANNPGVTYLALANMAAQDVVQDSGYEPGQP